jgi:hypothetical protein
MGEALSVPAKEKSKRGLVAVDGTLSKWKDKYLLVLSQKMQDFPCMACKDLIGFSLRLI